MIKLKQALIVLLFMAKRACAVSQGPVRKQVFSEKIAPNDINPMSPNPVDSLPKTASRIVREAKKSGRQGSGQVAADGSVEMSHEEIESNLESAAILRIDEEANDDSLIKHHSSQCKIVQDGEERWCHTFSHKYSLLGQGRCELGAYSKILKAWAEKVDDPLALIRRIGPHPVLYDQFWDQVNAKRNMAAEIPLGAPWVVLHPGGVYELRGFLSSAEADTFADAMKRNRAESQGWSGYDTMDYRKSIKDCHFQNFSRVWAFDLNLANIAYSLRLANRISTATGMPLSHLWDEMYASEFRTGEYLGDHFDEEPCTYQCNASDPNDFIPGTAAMVESGALLASSCNKQKRRDGTFLLYLTGPEEAAGGGTFFPKLDLRTHPQKGSAIFFRPTHADGSTNALMVHSGERVTRGTKYSIQQWMSRPPVGCRR